MKHFSRREFLKLAALLPLATVRAGQRRAGAQTGDGPNILIIVFDAWSSKHISMFGYQRETMPNLARLAERATVFHNHHAASDFTTPGTASLLTGTLPWTHRALHVAGEILPQRAGHNLFNLFSDYHSIAYSHNVLVNVLLQEMLGGKGLSEFVPFHEMMLYSDWVEQVFEKDSDVASVSRYFMFDKENPLTNSLFLADFLRRGEELGLERLAETYGDQFPLGLPRSTRNTHYILETGREWLGTNLAKLPQPFLGYFHFLPPHDPYRTRADFVGRFDDGWQPPEKPEHFMTEGVPRQRIQTFRRQYDEFIAYVDEEFARLYQALEGQGLLENTLLVLTSDHGEIFERGLVKHGTRTFHEPILRVPLLLFEPGQSERVDVKAATSAIDLLPTLAHLSGRAIPDWAEGQVLPPYKQHSAGREIFAVTARENSTRRPLTTATTAIVRGDYKLTRYEGYAQQPTTEPFYELYDVANDPEELNEISASQPGTSAELRDALLAAKGKADADFE